MRRFVILGAVVFAAFALRVHLLGAQELRGDEGFTWNYIQDGPVEIAARIIREGDPQPPLHYWLQWIWLKAAGDSEFAMRAWSAFLSLVLVPLMYQVGRRLWRAEAGLLASGLTAVHPQQVWLAQDVRNMYQLALILLLVATLLLGRLTPSRPGYLQKPVFWKYWLGYVLCGTLALYSHYYSIFVLLAHGAYYELPKYRSNSPAEAVRSEAGERDWTRDRGWRHWFLAGLAIAALVAPWALTIIPIYLRGQLADPGVLPLGRYAFGVAGDLAAGPAMSAAAKWTVLAGFVALAVVSTWFLASSPPARIYKPRFSRHHSPHLHIFLIAQLLVPFAGIYAVLATRATFNTFYFVFASPAAYLLAAGGAFVLYRRLKPLGLSVILAGLLVYSIGLGSHYRDPQYSKNRGMREVAAHLAEAAAPGDIYLTHTPDPAMVYYIRELALPFHLLPDRRDFDPAQVDAALDRLRDRRIWLVPATALDPHGYVRERLLSTALLAEDHSYNKMRLMLFLPLSQAQPLEAQFSDGIRLTGYYLTSNRLTLLWTAAARPSADYTVFVHALAADGYPLAQHDRPPPRPTSQWRPGSIVVDVHEFEIPTDQALTLVAGLYLPAAPEDRLPLERGVSGGLHAALVASLEP